MPEAAVLDDEAGLVYLNNRYHDPVLGTFISVDPLVQTTGEPYIYASGNPTTLSDPTGLFSCYVPGNPLACLDNSAIVRQEGSNGKVPLANATMMDVEVIWPSTTAILSEWDWTPIASTTLRPGFDSAGDPFAWLAGELEGGWHQLIDPVICGLKGINPVSGKVGNCSQEQNERREDYEEAGEAVCEASRTPIVGSAMPSGDPRSAVAWEFAEQGTKVTISTAIEGGVSGGTTVLRGMNAAGWAATAVDSFCRWGRP